MILLDNFAIDSAVPTTHHITTNHKVNVLTHAALGSSKMKRRGWGWEWGS